MYRTIIIVSGILFFISRLNIAFLLIRKQLRYIEAELFGFFFYSTCERVEACNEVVEPRYQSSNA